MYILFIQEYISRKIIIIILKEKKLYKFNEEILYFELKLQKCLRVSKGIGVVLRIKGIKDYEERDVMLVEF